MNHLESFAHRVESDPFFLACVLRDYARSEGLDDAALAAALGCNLETLTMVRLCRAPADYRFKEDIDQVVARFGLNHGVLVEAVRRGQAISSMKRQPVGETGGMLLAARDDERPPPKDDGEKQP
jgi:hypothetical protein